MQLNSLSEYHFPVCPVLCSTVFLTRIPDSAALRLCFLLGDTRSSRLGSLSLPVSSGLIGALTLQQLLRTASPDERPGPWRWRGRDQWLLTAFPPTTATTAGRKKQFDQDVPLCERLNDWIRALNVSQVLFFTFPEFSWSQRSLGSVEEWWRVEVKA